MNWKDAKSLRKAIGMTQEVFAAYIGVNPRTVCEWERPNGMSNPNKNSQRLLLQAMRRSGLRLLFPEAS